MRKEIREKRGEKNEIRKRSEEERVERQLRELFNVNKF